MISSMVGNAGRPWPAAAGMRPLIDAALPGLDHRGVKVTVV
jgi:hypothetical protein